MRAVAATPQWTWHEATAMGGEAELASLTVVAGAAIVAESGLFEVFQAVARWLAGRRLEVLQEKVFAPVAAALTIDNVRRHAYEAAGADPGVPFTQAGCVPCVGGTFAGLQIVAVRGAVRCRTVSRDGRPIGRLAEGAGQRLLFLSQLRGEANGAGEDDGSAALQAMFDLAAAELKRHGFSFRDVARTWIYLDDLVGHYFALNRVRNSCFESQGFRPSLDGWVYPASTGIQGADPSGAECFMDLVAAARGEQAPLHAALDSPRQGPAPAYGSAFSRGVALPLWGARALYVSGTASIDREGRTRHAGDPVEQIKMACDSADAVLRSAGSSLSRTAAGVIFFKDATTFEVWKRTAISPALAHLIPVFADVCRDELLFEIEATVFA